MTCKDCIHYDVCSYDGSNISGNEFANKVEEICDFFKDKSLIVELPCHFGDTIYYFNTYSERGGEYIDAGEVELVDIVEDAKIIILNDGRIIPLDEIGNTAFFTREEAKKALKERDK